MDEMDVLQVQTDPAVDGRDRDRRGRFQAGHKGLANSGRPPGVGNFDLRRNCEVKGVNPLAVALDILKTGYTPLDADKPFGDRKKVSQGEYLKLLANLLQYCLPRLAATTVSTEGRVQVATFDITKLMQDPAMTSQAQTLALGLAALQGDSDTAYGQPGSRARLLLDSSASKQSSEPAE